MKLQFGSVIFFIDDLDVSEHSVLEAAVREIGWTVSVRNAVEDKGKELLIKNTEEALDRGAFGVPR